MNHRSRLLFALSLAAAGIAPLHASDALPQDVVDTVFRLRVVGSALDTANLNGAFPGPTTGLVPVSSVLDREWTREKLLRGSLRDSWGRPILYWSDGSDYVVASFGADGLPQFDYALDPPYSGVPKGWAGTDPNDDLLIVDGMVFRGPSSQSEVVRRAVGEIRSAGTACESFAIDNNLYPGPIAPIDALSSIESDLSPIYIRRLPIVDPWGHPYRFWSNARAYAIVSFGVDGQPDYPYAAWGQTDFEALSVGPTSLIGPDLVFVNGRFVQWPGIGITP
jgi:hypothetical protein